MPDKYNKFNKFGITKKINEANIYDINIPSSEKIIWCKTRCNLKFNYDGITFSKNLPNSDTDASFCKLYDVSDDGNSQILFNNKEYDLSSVCITKTYHLRDKVINQVTEEEETSELNGGDEKFSEIFLTHLEKNGTKKLVICLIIYNYQSGEDETFNIKDKFNGNDIGEILDLMNKNQRIYLNDIFQTGYEKKIWGNSFYHYSGGLACFEGVIPSEADDVIVMKDIFKCSHEHLPQQGIYHKQNEDNEAYVLDQIDPSTNIMISFNLEGTLNSKPEKGDFGYDLVDCQEYTGLDDHLLVNDKKEESTDIDKDIEEDGYAVRLIKIIYKYKLFIIMWLIIIFQIFLFYYLLKYIYNKWNPNE